MSIGKLIRDSFEATKVLNEILKDIRENQDKYAFNGEKTAEEILASFPDYSGFYRVTDKTITVPVDIDYYDDDKEEYVISFGHGSGLWCEAIIDRETFSVSKFDFNAAVDTLNEC